jgi:hypothetical protein
MPAEGMADPRAARPGDLAALTASPDDPLAVAIARCDVAAIEAACLAAFRRLRGEMTAPQRKVFAAFLQSGGSQSQAMALLDLPAASTYPNALHRAKDRLRQVLAPHRAALLHILGAVRLRELLCVVFSDRPEAPRTREQP